MLIFLSSARAATWNVPGDFATFQEAIDYSVDDDEIVLGPGEYPGPFVISHPLTVRGAGMNATTLSATGTALQVAAEVVLEDLSLTTGQSGQCLSISGVNATLRRIRAHECGGAGLSGGALS